MKFKIYIIGKIKNKNLLFEVEELKKRISRIEIIYLKEIKEKNMEILKKKEFEIIKNNLDLNNSMNFLLWEFGKEYTTKDFYDYLKKNSNSGISTISFYITGAYGPNEDLKELIKNHLSLSKMTFTHEQALYLLLEQLYRFDCFEKNIPYTK